MAKVVNRAAPSNFDLSADESEHPKSEWLHNPPGLNGLLSKGVDPKYWKVSGGDVKEMTATEKAVIDLAGENEEKRCTKERGSARAFRALFKVIADNTGKTETEIQSEFNSAVDGG